MTHGPDRRVVVVGAAAVVLVALVLVAARLGVASPERHADGAGPLGSLRGISTIGIAGPVDAGDRMAYGLELCIVEGSDAAVIEAIRPTAVVGSGVTYLGARLRENDRSPNGALNTMAGGAVRGFPPPDLPAASLREAVGGAVTNPCAPNPNHLTELILGLESDGSASGGWHGVDVAYQAGSRHRVVSIAYDYLLCMRSEPDCQEDLVP